MKSPTKVIKEIPDYIQERMSKNSSNEDIFNIAKCEFEDVLKKSGFKVHFKMNDKKQKIELEILFDLTHHSTKQYPQMLQKFLLD